MKEVEFSYLHKGTDNQSPKRSALVVNNLLIMPVLLLCDSEEDDLTLLI